MTTSPTDIVDSRSATGQTLDEVVSSRRGLGQSTIMSVVSRTPIGPLSPWLAATITVALVGATIYVGWLVRESIRSGVRDSLSTVLDANVSALELWLRQQRETVDALAMDPKTSAAAIAWLDSPAPTDQSDLPVIDRAFPRDVSERIASREYLGWVLVDRIGAVIASNEDVYLGGLVPLTKGTLRQIDSGDAAVTNPFVLSTSKTPVGTASPGGEGGSGGRDVVVMATMSPIRRAGDTLGYLALLSDPGGPFTEILSVARINDFGDTYAFNRDGVLISRSRYESYLQTNGILQKDTASPLAVHIRIPESESTGDDRARFDPIKWPLTRMADHATRGGSDVDTLGYQDYRGVEVVGAWRWLDDYEIGVATELETIRAFAPIRILRNSFFILLSLVVLAGATLVAIAWITRPNRRQSQRVADLSRRLGQYVLRQRIGKGGMGTVYLGSHGLLDRDVAIKVLENADANERTLARFQREVQLTAKLKHPNTIEIYDFGRTDEGTFFYVMEFVEGISLEQLVEFYGRQPAERVIYLLLQVCASLAEAHQAGLVHRDIKPANVLVTSRAGLHDLVKVLDFGLAKQVDHETMQLTRVEGLTGTPLFMSPESIRDASSAGPLSDIYSIGAVGYTLLSGVAPFEADSSADVCAKKLHEHPQRPDKRLGIPLVQDLQDLLLQCLRLDPSERPQSIDEVVRRLALCEDSSRWNQYDASLWWQQVFDGPYVDEFGLETDLPSADGTKGDTAVSDKPSEKLVKF